MRADFRIANAAERIEGPLLFLKRSVNVGLNEALYVIGRDGVERLGRVATLDEDTVIVEVPNPGHPYGVRGVGETGITPPLPALANAIAAATGARMRHLPMTPAKVLKAMRSENA